jgi:hypothetical protein
MYESSIALQEDGKYLAVILQVSGQEPNYDTVKEREADTLEEATIWVDDEITRLETGKGVWDI